MPAFRAPETSSSPTSGPTGMAVGKSSPAARYSQHRRHVDLSRVPAPIGEKRCRPTTRRTSPSQINRLTQSPAGRFGRSPARSDKRGMCLPESSSCRADHCVPIVSLVSSNSSDPGRKSPASPRKSVDDLRRTFVYCPSGRCVGAWLRVVFAAVVAC